MTSWMNYCCNPEEMLACQLLLLIVPDFPGGALQCLGAFNPFNSLLIEEGQNQPGLLMCVMLYYNQA